LGTNNPIRVDSRDSWFIPNATKGFAMVASKSSGRYAKYRTIARIQINVNSPWRRLSIHGDRGEVIVRTDSGSERVAGFASELLEDNGQGAEPGEGGL